MLRINMFAYLFCSRAHACSHASICVLIIIITGFNKSNVLTKTRKETKRKGKKTINIIRLIGSK